MWAGRHKLPLYPYQNIVCKIIDTVPKVWIIGFTTQSYRTNQMIIIEGKENIAVYRMMTLEKALKLEMIGLKGRGKSAYSIIKSEFGLKGNREKVHAQFKEMIRELTE